MVEDASPQPNALDVEIGPARAADLPDIVEIERRSFPTPWSIRALETEVLRLRPHSHVLVARVGSRTVAFAVYWAVADECHLLNFAVHPDFRRRGIARRLLRAVLDDARSRGLRRATLEVRPSNEAARRLYESEGFRIVGVRPGYYEDTGEDALIMWKDDLVSAQQGPKVRFWRRRGTGR